MTVELFSRAGIEINGIRHLSTNEALVLCKKGVVLVDVREKYMSSFKQFDLENCLKLPLSLLKENPALLLKEEYYIIADAVGLRSKEAVELLKGLGFTNIANLSGGIVAWERNGLSIKVNNSYRLTGSCKCQLKPGE